MNKEAPRTEEWIDRHGRGVSLIHEECQPRRQNGRNPTKSSEKTPDVVSKPTRIRLNYEPNAGKSAHRTFGTHEQQSIREIPAYTPKMTTVHGCGIGRLESPSRKGLDSSEFFGVTAGTRVGKIGSSINAIVRVRR